MDDQLFVAIRRVGKLDALLDLAVRLEQVENGQVVQIVIVFLHKVEEVVLQDLDLFLLDPLLHLDKFYIRLAILLIINHLVGPDCCDFGEH